MSHHSQQFHHHTDMKMPTDMRGPARNRYFYGKMLDVFHMELETNYFNYKRCLLNRLISGYGVVCGLDVILCADGKSFVVSPGVAIDKWGREIIVPVPSQPQAFSFPNSEQVSTQEQESYEDDDFVHVLLCYHECLSDPVPTLAGDCETTELCTPGTIRERYKIAIEPGKAPEIDTQCPISCFISGNKINYKALAEYITRTRGCTPNCDPCITLANIRKPESGADCEPNDVDIGVRQIVYTNDLLFELLLCLTSGEQERPKGGKR